MQRPVDVEVNVAAFVPEVAGGTVLAPVQVRQSRKLRVLCLGPAGCRSRVHGGPSIEMGWWFHPGKIKVARLLGAGLNVQCLLEGGRVHPSAQRLLLARRRKARELPGLVGAV